MPVTRNEVLSVLSRLEIPGGGTLIDRDMVRALTVEGTTVRFVIEAADATQAEALEDVRARAQAALAALEGVGTVSVVLTAPAASRPAPGIRIGRHPTPEEIPLTGVERIVAVASGKGGVGKSTVATNLAVALARQGRRVGLLDADIHGPSVPRMMGVSGRPGATPGGKTILPPQAHGVTLMSIGLMLEDGQAVVWRGPMLMGALQQMLGQVHWGELDVLIVDLPPGTGDVQLTLCQRTNLTGALVVSTPQDVALLDARKAIDMFNKLKTPVLGLIENMSGYICPNCGHEAHIFGHGGVRAEAAKIGVPFLGELPLALEVRQGGDAGAPVAAGDGPLAEAYARLAEGMVRGGVA
ncbi:ATP-binding protein involved in chromosome partitioning [Rhodovulum imhoffii]|uniref:Iron-sulfur cluster carrier protein n=1 Tax=Rhodovulum imhoffii TaxID=365340 RepID=A0A2T5BPK0_9RHOB|nr:Mrp/NBP35 family ATP-binding protein [Rhodovulum imhoffii]MBK5932876.1 sodium:proton antiporter [Rhodovulum imhoffii]PTN00967.1 ATP-binding protein involved in chromosome partitioning [Rhodovulum imhoffii]